MSGFLPENPGVLVMDIIAEIRRRHFIGKETITSLAEAFKLSRPTIRKHLKTIAEPVYQRQNQPPSEVRSISRAVRSLAGTRGSFPSKTKAYGLPNGYTNFSRSRIIGVLIRWYSAM
jgi:DNA-binding transcriptional ArsR family regulator